MGAVNWWKGWSGDRRSSLVRIELHCRASDTSRHTASKLRKMFILDRFDETYCWGSFHDFDAVGVLGNSLHVLAKQDQPSCCSVRMSVYFEYTDHM